MNTKLFSAILLLTIGFQMYVNRSFAQTNPTAQPLPYSQNFTALLATSTTYPAGWQGWNLSTSGSGVAFKVITPPASSDLTLIASSTAAINSGGTHNYNGKIGLLSSGSVDATLCLAINTTGVFNIQVNYDIMTIRNPADVSNNRVNQVDLQYRVGTSGNFTSVGGLANGIYSNNLVNQIGAVTTPQLSSPKAAVLPAVCNNQAVVQIRWVQRDFTGAGSRPSFALDNLVICTTSSTPTIAISGPTAFCNGGSATYTSTITNGGTAPVYSWKKNGITVGTNSSTVTLSGLILNDQITCVLTSNLSCLSNNGITSNILTIGTVNSSPTITNASLTHISCPGAKNGAIDISVSGGTPPYTIAWDTTNTLNGATFGVTVGSKTAAHPFFSFPGFSLAYYIDGVEGKQLSLTKGISYSFNVLTPGHPFHISTDSVGTNINNIVNSGQSGAPTTSGTVLFKPGTSTPQLLYYPCQFHAYMGSRIRINNGFLTEDLTNRRAGTYTVIVTDANGCTTTGQYTLNELPNNINIAGLITNATCLNPTGSIDISVNGGQGPYTYNWDTLNTINGANFGITVGSQTPGNPFFGLGNFLSFYIDGIEVKELNLQRGVKYTFNIFNPAHPWHISTDNIGGNSSNIVTNGQSGAPIDNGVVNFTPNLSHPSQLFYVCANHPYMGGNINIFNSYSVEDPSNLQPGTYSVTVTDVFGCSASQSFTIDPASNCSIPLNITAMIEGFYLSGGQMIPALANQGASANMNEVDTLHLELRDPNNVSIVVAQATSILNTDGTISFNLPSAIEGSSEYVVLLHRNSLETWSASPIVFSGVTNYNFSNSATKAYGSNMKEVETGIWAFYSGDIEPRDEFIDVFDQSVIDNDAQQFLFGYFPTDVNGDGFVDVFDQAVIDNNASLFVFSVHP